MLFVGSKIVKIDYKAPDILLLQQLKNIKNTQKHFFLQAFKFQILIKFIKFNKI